MPGRVINPLLASWDMLCLLAFASLAAAESVGMATSPGVTFGSLIALTGFLGGFYADWVLRQKAYESQPAHERRPLAAEIRRRLMWAALGLLFGALIAYAANGVAEILWPRFAPVFAPAVNFVAVMNALLIIEFLRGMAKLLTGQSVRNTLAGALLAWAEKRGRRDEP